MTTFIVDASIAAKWFFVENHSLEAECLLQSNHTFHAPDFLLIEMADILWKKKIRGDYVSSDDMDFF